MKKIWIVAHFCSDFESKGNNRFNYLATLLAEAGYGVEFITSDFSHTKKKPRSRQVSGLAYRVCFIHEPGYRKNVGFDRLYSHAVFGKNLKNQFAQMEKPEVVYLAVPSLDAGKATAEYCKTNHIPLVIDVQDLWPEAFCLATRKYHIPEWIYAPMKKKADYIYRAADCVFAVSETYLNRANQVRENGRGQCVFIGTDLAAFDAYPTIAMDKPWDEIWIAYAGTLGSSYNIDIIIDAVRLLANKGVTGFRFKVFGDGPAMERFKARAHGLPVDFHGRLPYKDMVGSLRNCDIAVNPIMKGAAQSIINKHADYAAAGLPVVSTQECPEYRALLDEFNCGINCPPEDTQAVADALEGLLRDPALRKRMGENSRRMAQERFDRKHTYQQIIAEIERFVR